MKVVNEDTLEMTELEEIKDIDEVNRSLKSKITSIMNFEPKELSEKYRAYKKAEEEFKKIYEPFKKNLVSLHKSDEEFSKFGKAIVVDNVKLVYVSPSTRSTIDTKKLKEEHPEIAKEFTKITNVDATIRIEDLFMGV